MNNVSKSMELLWLRVPVVTPGFGGDSMACPPRHPAFTFNFGLHFSKSIITFTTSPSLPCKNQGGWDEARERNFSHVQKLARSPGLLLPSSTSSQTPIAIATPPSCQFSIFCNTNTDKPPFYHHGVLLWLSRRCFGTSCRGARRVNGSAGKYSM